MANTPVVAQTLSLIGAATVLGVVHSMIVPSNLTLDTEAGFTVPGAGSRAGSVADDGAAVPSSTAADEADDPVQMLDAEPVTAAAPAEGAGHKIGLAQAVELHGLAMAGEQVLFLDARLESDYEAGHIDGAFSMPFTRLGTDEGIDTILMLASPGDGTLFVIYCTGGDCEASEDTAIRLTDLGFDNFAIMADGYEDWKAAGHPVSAGTGGP